MYRLILLLVFISHSLAAQPKIGVTLKKKYFGYYQGKIEGYNVDVGEKILRTDPVDIFITLTKDSVFLTIGNNQLKGTYNVMFRAKKYYLLEADMNGQDASERLIVYIKGKKMRRDGMYPQPVVELKKVRKKKH